MEPLKPLEPTVVFREVPGAVATGNTGTQGSVPPSDDEALIVSVF